MTLPTTIDGYDPMFRSVYAQLAELEVAALPAELELLLHEDDFPGLTHVAGVKVRRVREPFIERGQGIVVNVAKIERMFEAVFMAHEMAPVYMPEMCPLCGWAHGLLPHTGPLPKHEVTGLLNGIGSLS